MFKFRLSVPAMGLLAAAGLAACASSTPYTPAGIDGQYGFTEQKIEENRFRITFRGNSLTSRETVETYLLFRSAELTLENGYDHFLIVSDETEKETSYTGTRYPRPSYYGRGRAFPYYGWGYRWDPLYDDVEIRERNRYSAMAYVVMGRGEKPESEPTAYDARSVIENLASSVERVSSD